MIYFDVYSLTARPSSIPASTSMRGDSIPVSPRTPPLSRPASASLKEGVAIEDCGVCLDAAEEVAFNGCNHMLCGEHHAVVCVTAWCLSSSYKS